MSNYNIYTHTTPPMMREGGREGGREAGYPSSVQIDSSFLCNCYLEIFAI